MTIRKNIVTGALAVTGAVGLVGCGGDKGSQDVGTNAGTESRPLYARVVDGYIAGATVYVDQNENGTLDAFEPRAVTDRDGFFSYNHVTGTDYCASDTPDALKKHCLRAPIGADPELLIRVTGGYDTVTGLPFKGILSLRAKDLDKNDLRLVTPLTSLGTGDDPEVFAEMLRRIGLLNGGRSLLDDYIAGGDIETAMKAALIHKIVEVLTDGINAGGNISPELRNHIFSVAYDELSKWLENGSLSFDGTLDSNAVVAMLLGIAHALLKPGESMPVDFTLPNMSVVFEKAKTIARLIEHYARLARLTSHFTSDEARKAMLRALAVVMERTAANPDDPEVADFLGWIENQTAQPGGIGADLAGLGGDDIDISTLIDPSFNFDPLSNSISASAKIPPEAAQVFALLVNTMFRISVNDGDRQGAALVFISGTNGASSGNLDVCVRYKDSRGDFNTGSSSNPNGALLVNGSWSLINNHTLTLSINVSGGVRPLLIKSVGVRGSDQKYRFDFGGDFSEWLGSAPAPFAVGAVPTSDATCQTALIEAFGPVT